jgi:hypothetical protein
MHKKQGFEMLSSKKELTGAVWVNTIFQGAIVLYLTLYVPTALMSYLPHWYVFNCKFHSRCEMVGHENAIKYVDELNRFFFHKSPLPFGWTEKEKLHLGEVRDIMDTLAIIALICIILLVLVFNRSKITSCAIFNLSIITSILLLMPFFKTFWVNILHPLLFNNDLWINDPFDRSFYIMPWVFFKHSFIGFISISAFLNGFLWLSFRKYRGEVKCSGIEGRG